jgi:hypothetical protein
MEIMMHVPAAKPNGSAAPTRG